MCSLSGKGNEMESNNLGVRGFHLEAERMKDRGKQIDPEKTLKEMEMEMEGEDGDSDGWEKEGGDERENAFGRVEEFNKDLLPSVDDVCPICFDMFSIPCRSNCGHWFCATCILQFWMFRSSIQPCKCPLCCCRIVKLEPRASGADDSVEVLKKVHQYNGLYITGVFGAFHKIQAFPLFVGRIFRVLIDPDCLRCIHYVTRILGLSLALLYERGEFEFMPSGGMGIQRMFNLGGSVLIVILFTIGVVYRWVLRRRARRFAALQVWDS